MNSDDDRVCQRGTERLHQLRRIWLTKPGPHSLVSGVYGDETSSVHPVQTLMNQLDPRAVSDTVTAVMDVSSPPFPFPQGDAGRRR